MRNSIYLILLFFIFIIGCEKQKKEYPNVDLTQVIQDMKWDYNYEKVKNILEMKYGIAYNKEIEQSNNNQKVYEFLGGKINGINTQSWVVAFNNDSLDVVLLKIESETAEQNSKTFQKIKENISVLSYDKFSKRENDWILLEKEKSICGLQILSTGKGIVMSFSSNKFINKYSYM